MNISKISTKLLIISIYIITLFCGIGTLYSNNLIPKETVTMTLQEALEKYMSGKKE